jgi:hypothetical protein
MYPGAEAGAHLAGDNCFEQRVRVEFYYRCERAGLGVIGLVLNV